MIETVESVGGMGKFGLWSNIYNLFTSPMVSNDDTLNENIESDAYPGQNVPRSGVCRGLKWELSDDGILNIRDYTFGKGVLISYPKTHVKI